MNNLNKEQYQAVTSQEKNILVIAGAGTGKTKVLVNRIAYLLAQGVPEKEILAFTFTNKAANEMKERIKAILNKPHSISISTFHSYCYQLLKDFHQFIGFEQFFSIIDDDDRSSIIKKIIKEKNLEIIDKVALKAISFIKNHTHQDLELYDQVLINHLFHKYQDKLHSCNKMDFDDLLYYTYQLLQNETIAEVIGEDIGHILIDECQDTNRIQMNIIYQLGNNSNIFMVGDYNQAIYAFRGSDLKNSEIFINLKNPKVFKLSLNYRSSGNIINAANALIDNNKQHITNFLTAQTLFDSKYQLINAKLIDENSEAQYVCQLIDLLVQRGYSYEQIAILYRNNSTSHELEKELLLKKIPYLLYGTRPFFKYSEIKNLINYYRLIYNHNDDIAFNQIVNLPTRGIGQQTLNLIIKNAEKKNLSYFQSLEQMAHEQQCLNDFLNMINELAKDFSKQAPSTFLKQLVQRIKYTDHVMNLPDPKAKMNRLYDFYSMLSSLEIVDGQAPDKITINFLNEIMLATDNNEDNKSAVKLMTIHQSKGLEFPVVIIIGMNHGILPPNNLDSLELEEERRLFYVAITRAKERLYLLSTHNRIINGKKAFLRSSPFLNEIGSCLINTALKDK